VAEGEYGIELTQGGVWTVQGTSLAEAAAAAAKTRAKAGLGDRSADIVAEVAKHPDGIGPSQIAKALNLDEKQVQVYLGRLADANRVCRLGRGRYAPVPPVGSVGSPRLTISVPTLPTHPTAFQGAGAARSQ
jgi:DNA-binding CsgD family transcriptional regulator